VSDLGPGSGSGLRADPRLTATDGRLRARGHGVRLRGRVGPVNAVTDVQGIEVGLVTLISGHGALVPGTGPVRTGVTAIHPRGRAGTPLPCAAGWFSLNGNGEMTGTTWITESGSLTTPVVLTNTHAVGTAHRGVIDWIVANHPAMAEAWLLPVAAETWDGYLNDINGRHVTEQVVCDALQAARGGPVPLGSVGGGTGMNCYGFTGGTGTSSRLVEVAGAAYTVGALVQANFGSRHELTVAGVPLGDLLADDDPLGSWELPAGAGSVITVIGTDAPLLPQQCTALARRVAMGLARTGTTGGHFSGDVFLAFSTANPGALRSQLWGTGTGLDRLEFVPWGAIDPLYEATAWAVEEAVLDALFVNDEMVGRDGHRVPALPVAAVLEALAASGGIPG